MTDLFLAPAASASPVMPPPAPARRRCTMPARFLWPGDRLVIDGRERELTRVETDGASVVVYAGGGALTLPVDAVQTVISVVSTANTLMVRV